MQGFCPSYSKSRCKLQRLFICWGVTYALPRLSALLAVNSFQPWVARHIHRPLHYFIPIQHFILFAILLSLALLLSYVTLGAVAQSSSSVSGTSAANYKLENTRAARLGVGASHVAHSSANSALALGIKISGSIKRARSQKLEHEDEDQPKGWDAAVDDQDSKCASIKRKIGLASEVVRGVESRQKKKKNKKKKMSATAAESAPAAPVILKPSPSIHNGVSTINSTLHQDQEPLHSLERSSMNAAASHKHSQQLQGVAHGSSANASNDADVTGLSLNKDLGSGLRNFHPSMRKRTKTRSKAKNLKKDKRPPELRPGGEKLAVSMCVPA